jgi:hypothetical protein
MNLFNNRRGKEAGEMILFVMFIFVLAIIGVGIAIGLGLFYGQPLDYRLYDATLLNAKLSRCLVEHSNENGFFENMYSVCGVSKKVIEANDFVIGIYDSTTNYIKHGDLVQCDLQDKNAGYARCVSRLLSVRINEEMHMVTITTGSNQRYSLQ